MLEHLVLLSQMLVQLKHRRDISTPVAIIRCAPYGDNRLVEHKLEALHRELMRTRDEVDGVVMSEDLGDVGAEQEARSPRREAPAGDVCGGVTRRVKSKREARTIRV